MKTIIAVDPGVTTGYAVAELDEGELRPIRFDQDADQQHFLECAWNTIKREGSSVIVVCETYTITAETLRKTRQTASLEIIGALRWMIGHVGGELVMQSPANAKRLATDDRLKATGWWSKTTRDHANDAARHLFLWATKARIIDPIQVDHAEG